MERIPKRNEVNVRDTWALEDLYESDEALAEDIKKLGKMMGEFGKYKGHLGEGNEVLMGMLDAYSNMNKLFEKIYVYANQRFHEDMRNDKYQQLSGKSKVLMNKLNSVASYMIPEILKIPEEKIEGYYEENLRLFLYRTFLDDIIRRKGNTLSTELEELLAKAGDMAKSPGNIYAMFHNADITFESIRNEKGEMVPLTQARYSMYLESADRRVRKEAFQHLYDGYASFKNTLTAVFESNIKQASFFAQARNYDTTLDATLDSSDIPTRVYDNLIQTVHSHLPLLHRYMALRKKALSLDELHMYDLYVPMVSEVKKKYSFEEAKGIVAAGLEPLGEEYGNLLQKGFNNRWIDVYENAGKRTGAYSWGAYGTHPYVLLNYQGSLNDVFTLAHEMGHALHSWLSDSSQPYIYAGYKTFVAEVASTCNEALLIHYLMKSTDDRKYKAYLINHFLEQFRATLFRQTMLADFEKMTHMAIDTGGILTTDALCKVYYDLNIKYFGPDVVVDEEIKYEWARIPHFYTPFYVYQYATGFSAAIAISSKILEGDEYIIKKYTKFLKSGSSRDPISLLKICGIDMKSSTPIEEALEVFEQYLSELEKIYE